LLLIIKENKKIVIIVLLIRIQLQHSSRPVQQHYQQVPPLQQPVTQHVPLPSGGVSLQQNTSRVLVDYNNVLKSRIKTSIDEKVLLLRTQDEEAADGRVQNKETSQKIRDTWIYKQVGSRQDEFTQYRQVSNLLL
jgi:hypothetical protein